MSGPEEIAAAVRLLRAGQVVGLPTETVYGLAADADSPEGVRRIFEVKGRPAGHPLIVHLAHANQLDAWALGVPDTARLLSRLFWPGPLTLVLPRAPRVLNEVTGGQPTVALRVPRHPVALALLSAFGGGLAAPSANRFQAVSPTSAAHVRADLGNAVPLVLDGGTCAVGLESTIVDLSEGYARLLRPGGVSLEAVEAALGCAVPIAVGAVRASGEHALHYAPRARLELISGDPASYAHELEARGVSVAVLPLGADLEDASRSLYAALREADASGAAVILAQLPAQSTGLGLALRDRLLRAGGPRE